jgi:hypothetical protein
MSDQIPDLFEWAERQSRSVIFECAVKHGGYCISIFRRGHADGGAHRGVPRLVPAAQQEDRVMLRVLSLGAGVQSTTLALMAAHGEIEPPDCAIFADTGWEQRHVYDHLNWLSSPNVLPFPIHRVSAGNIRDDIGKVLAGASISGRGRAVTAPFWVRGADGLAAPLRRQCTGHYKVEPIERWLKTELGIKPRQRQPKTPLVELWIGISTDEIYRIKPAQQLWIKRRWPLVYDVRMNRNDCLRWLERRGYPQPQKSSCIGCPYHSNEHWRDMRNRLPKEFAEAVAVDHAIRSGFKFLTHNLETAVYMHRSLAPLDEVDLSSAAERGQGDLFNNECEGMCGV